MFYDENKIHIQKPQYAFVFKKVISVLVLTGINKLCTAQQFNNVTQNCVPGTATSSISASLSAVTAPDGVVLTPSLWLSNTVLDNDLADDCVSLNDCSLFPYYLLYPPCTGNSTYKRKPVFAYSNSLVPAGGIPGGSGAKPIYINRATTSNTASNLNPSIGATANLHLDFTSGTTKRPQGLSFTICDVDNPYDRVQVKVYAGGNLLDYTYATGSYISVSNTGNYLDADFSAPVTFTDNDAIFTSLAWNDATANSNWNNAVIKITVNDNTAAIDSVVVSHVTREQNRPDMNPSWAVGDFKWAAIIVLPLDFISFSGKENNCLAQLSWQTANEQNTSHFEVESSTDNLQWSKAGTLNAQGNGNGKMYSFAIVQNRPMVYYRLRMADIDGRYTYSPVVTVRSNCGDKKFLTVYPNPVTSGLLTMISGTDYRGKATLQVMNTSGQIVISKIILITSNSFNEQLSVTQVPKGNYLLRILDKDGQPLFTSQKIIVK